MDAVSLASAKADAKKNYGAAGLARFMSKVQNGETVKVTWLGDSILEGQTSTTPGTDDCASLVCSTLATRYGVTVTKQNRAVSGYTVQRSSVAGNVAAAIADNPALLVISFGHNDIKSDGSPAGGTPGWGYPRASSLGGIERIVRRFRKQLPDTDIVLMSESGYASVYATTDAQLVTYNQAFQKIARRYGCLWVDGHAAVAVIGDTAFIADNTHPNSSGHAALANAILAQFPPTAAAFAATAIQPAVPESVLNTSAQWHDNREWAVSANPARVAGASGFSLNGTWSAGPPYTSQATGAGVNIQGTFSGLEAVLVLTGGAGQGVVNIDVDGNRLYTNLDLSTYATGTIRVPIVAATPGVHSFFVRVVSGTVTVTGMEYLPAPADLFDFTAARVTLTGTWTTASGTDGNYFNRNKATTVTTGDSFSFDFDGTDCYVHVLLSAPGPTAITLTPTVDGVAKAAVSTGAVAGTASSSPGLVALVTGMEPGRHTVSVVVTIAGGSGLTFTGGTICALDSTRTARPRKQSGIAKVGETVTYPVPYTNRPRLRLWAIDSTSTAPPYPTSPSNTGFTVAGTAGALVVWESDGGLVAF